MLSRAILTALKLSDRPAYKWAQDVDLHPSALSAWTCGIRTPRADYPRLHRLAQMLGVPEGTPLLESSERRRTTAAPHGNRSDIERCAGA